MMISHSERQQLDEIDEALGFGFFPSNGVGRISAIHELKKHFAITLDEARVLNKLLRVHAGLFRESFSDYEQLLRLINGLGMFVDKHEMDK